MLVRSGPLLERSRGSPPCRPPRCQRCPSLPQNSESRLQGLILDQDKDPKTTTKNEKTKIPGRDVDRLHGVGRDHSGMVCVPRPRILGLVSCPFRKIVSLGVLASSRTLLKDGARSCVFSPVLQCWFLPHVRPCGRIWKESSAKSSKQRCWPSWI